MRPALLVPVVLISLAFAGPSLAASEFCEQLQAYEQAPLAKLPDGGLQRRWMDVSWAAAPDPRQGVIQIGATLKCESSDDVAKTFCSYAIHHTSHEFSEGLPLQILSCHGFVSKASPRHWVEELSWDTPTGLIERIQIDQLDRTDAEPSMRLTIMPFPESPGAKKPPPFFKALSAKLGFEDEE